MQRFDDEKDGNQSGFKKIYFKNGIAKVLIGLCKGKKTFDKRETIKKRDIERENQTKFKLK